MKRNMLEYSYKQSSTYPLRYSPIKIERRESKVCFLSIFHTASQASITTDTSIVRRILKLRRILERQMGNNLIIFCYNQSSNQLSLYLGSSQTIPPKIQSTSIIYIYKTILDRRVWSRLYYLLSFRRVYDFSRVYRRAEIKIEGEYERSAVITRESVLPLASTVEGFTMVMGRDKAEITGGGTFLERKAWGRSVSMITVQKKKKKKRKVGRLLTPSRRVF